MDSFLTMERFLKMRGNLITPLFSTLSLDHDFEFHKSQHGPVNSLSTEIEYVRRNLKRIGDDEKISRLFRIVNYALYIHAVDLGDRISEKTFISQDLYHNFISTYLGHQNLNQINRDAYLDLCKNNHAAMLTSDKFRRFEKLLDEEGFDSKAFNLSAIFLVLFWANLEMLARAIQGKTVTIKNHNEELYQVVRDERGEAETAIINMEVAQMIKDCTECHMLLHYVGKFFIQKESAEMKYIESFGENKAVKNTQVKGGKGKGETGHKLVEITRFFWEKCNEKKPNLSIKTFAEALYYACNDEKAPSGMIESVKNLIKDLNEKEKISVLNRSNAKPKAIAARLSGIKK